MDLFNEPDNRPLFQTSDLQPLADRMRPDSFDTFWGQHQIIGPDQPLRKAIEADKVTSLVFWGPPGTGKTTLASLIARLTNGQFVAFSAVTSGIKEVKEIISKAASYYSLTGRRTYLFIDEIHRFNKAQQDAFLPYVEKGEIILIGATTENPSFEINAALLSRMRVYVLERLSENDLVSIYKQALIDADRGLGEMSLHVSDEVLLLLAQAADGDARRGLHLLEQTAVFVGQDGDITEGVLRKVYQKNIALYDKAGEEHYNLISVLHKTIRGGDADASLYWLARMLDGGEDPLYIVRRLVRFATEDIGLADPFALTVTLNARDTYRYLGSPEGELAIAEAVLYLACAPKSNSVYIAFAKAKADAQEKGSLPVPLGLRNAPTSLMKDIGYGDNYQYAHDYDDGITSQEYFPDELKGRRYYEPKEVGREKRNAEYLAWFQKMRAKKKSNDAQ